MGKYVCKCKCGKYYTHDELQSAACPICGEVGNNFRTQQHQCSFCKEVEKCPMEKQELTKKAGVCFNYKN